MEHYATRLSQNGSPQNRTAEEEINHAQKKEHEMVRKEKSRQKYLIEQKKKINDRRKLENGSPQRNDPPSGQDNSDVDRENMEVQDPMRVRGSFYNAQTGKGGLGQGK